MRDDRCVQKADGCCESVTTSTRSTLELTGGNSCSYRSRYLLFKMLKDVSKLGWYRVSKALRPLSEDKV